MIASIDEMIKMEIKQALDFICALFGILFKLYKFRSVSDARDKMGIYCRMRRGLGSSGGRCGQRNKCVLERNGNIPAEQQDVIIDVIKACFK